MEDGEQREWGAKAWTYLSSVRSLSPLIQCITNFVSMDLTANTLLSAGASPAMLHSPNESPDFTPQVNALYINVGTLSDNWLPAMELAAQLASKLNKPWVLDPVAAGASRFRLKACLDLISLKPTVIRGNASEIIALAKASFASTKGVDSSHDSTDAVEAAKSLANSSGAVVAVLGAVDFVTDGNRIVGARNGVPMMQKITATGCAFTALIAAFVAIDPSHAMETTASALAVFGVAGELGMETARGPASLRTYLIDSLHGLDQTAVISGVKITAI
ncbi:hypothetical protein ERO13_A10G120500v2 [Gossypium hirsutum]|uniref:hydroxyethylthiazole kinase n=1 Tax=Gossypium hirsutum TaxID=3635 RepID=A0ABM2YWI6_GOSHI|nr:hydroxyethylthiazole kinase-like [Gossypium hirsutum]XP_040934865.1 hydroxyethylthiazole kinase-like [Gossypium hirsutum]XP_040934866.1 hydroxyethylthiazole kinase-like [Gossypium hirsutum]KAG4179695.1 hypothetical protein ERO13_A10G120500v2 [Gossypium hirsutum]